MLLFFFLPSHLVFPGGGSAASGELVWIFTYLLFSCCPSVVELIDECRVKWAKIPAVFTFG